MAFNLDTKEVKPSIAGNESALATNVTAEDMRDGIEKLTKHGALYQLEDQGFVEEKVNRLMAAGNGKPEILLTLTKTVKEQAKKIFKHLADQLPSGRQPYNISSSLISHLTFPNDGRTYTRPGETNDNEKIPVFMTFVGQFIDHDLTLNPMSLFDIQNGDVPNDASPLIDLDSVYNRDSVLAYRKDEILNKDGSFRLNLLGPHAYDLERETQAGKDFAKPFICDLRNDENQIILQVHILLIRLHNAFIKNKLSYEDAKKEVIYAWQSFIINEYLPTVISKEPLDWVLSEIKKADYGNMVHKPEPDGSVRMPHEFAIGFRMGHSQLRDFYRLQKNGSPIPLFDNRNPDRNRDLTGNKPLQPDHVIDWQFFSQPELLSNKIDGKVTSTVFDLPESAIPDAVTKVGNLPQRNLIRSVKVGLASAEDLFQLYSLPKDKVLTPEQVEADAEKRKLFQLDNEGRYSADNRFRTPLWYYVLKEAEYFNGGGQLGPLGGRIIGEVIAGGIYFNKDAYVHNKWQSVITKSDIVKFKDIVAYVLQNE